MTTTTETKKIFADGGINWTWYLEVIDHGDNTVTILKYHRLHNFNEFQGSEKHPKVDGGVNLIESKDGKRIVESIKTQFYDQEKKIWTENFCTVRNPQYVFSYN